MAAADLGLHAGLHTYTRTAVEERDEVGLWMRWIYAWIPGKFPRKVHDVFALPKTPAMSEKGSSK